MSAPPPDRFEAAYVRPAQPAVFTDLARDWPATRRWSWAHLAEHHGALPVDVARVEASRVALEPGRGLVLEPQPLARWLEALARGEARGYAIAWWQRLGPKLQAEVPQPEHCANAAHHISKLWLSSKGTLSPLHFDLTDNLHTVLLGSKRFTLFPPGDAFRLYPQPLSTRLPYVAQVDPEAPDLSRFPRFAGARPFTVELQRGETLFIPRLWWHQVRTLEDCASVNSWWATGAWSAVASAANFAKRVLSIN
ncbi:MAG: cupin-like domain-containing protein [Archangiaceae bacterium]|nr:cupin-like domain-containing protein [Archangiaceae bacterium]